MLALFLLPPGSAVAQAQRRLPDGYRWGRCLLVVDGQTRISGRCAYHIGKGGDFSINGPRQIYSGIDYPVPPLYADVRSTDYWANVFRDGDGWTGYGNSIIEATHGDGDWGALSRQGACLTGRKVKICLWRR